MALFAPFNVQLKHLLFVHYSFLIQYYSIDLLRQLYLAWLLAVQLQTRFETSLRLQAFQGYYQSKFLPDVVLKSLGLGGLYHQSLVNLLQLLTCTNLRYFLHYHSLSYFRKVLVCHFNRKPWDFCRLDLVLFLCTAVVNVIGTIC